MKAIEEVLHGWADYEKIREFLAGKNQAHLFHVGNFRDFHTNHSDFRLR